MPPMSDLVKLHKLDTQFDSNYTRHFRYVRSSGADRKRIWKEERWKRQRRVGRGGYGTVWLEECIYGDPKGQLRAVKEIAKHESGDFNRELEAIALFSQDEVGFTLDLALCPFIHTSSLLY